MNVFNSFISKVETNIIDPAIILLGLAAFILFAYGVFEMIRGAESSEARATGTRHMIWGIVGLAIMFGATTIIAIMKKTIGVT